MGAHHGVGHAVVGPAYHAAPVVHAAPVAHHAVHHAAPVVHHAPAYHAAPVAHHAVHHAAPVVHHAAPAYHAAPAEVYPDEVSPYTYQYAVADDYSNSNFNAAESDDGTGKRDFIFWDAVYFTTSRLQSTYYIYMMPYSIY